MLLYPGVHPPAPRCRRLPIGGIFCLPRDRPCLVGVIEASETPGCRHDPLIPRIAGIRYDEGFVDPHDRRNVGALKPSRKIRDRFQIERAMLVVDHAVIETGGLDDPRHAAGGEFLKPGTKRGPPLAHRSPNAVLFHGSRAPIPLAAGSVPRVGVLSKPESDDGEWLRRRLGVALPDTVATTLCRYRRGASEDAGRNQAASVRSRVPHRVRRNSALGARLMGQQVSRQASPRTGLGVSSRRPATRKRTGRHPNRPTGCRRRHYFPCGLPGVDGACWCKTC